MVTSLSVELMKNAIKNAFDQINVPKNSYRPEAIVTMSEELRLFLQGTASIFHETMEHCGNVDAAGTIIRMGMKKLEFPIWVLKSILSKEDVKSFGAEIDKSGIDEVVIVEAVDADAASRIQAKLQQRYNSKKQQGASYSPEDLQIIKNCSVKTNGNIVSMIISSNAGAMEEVLNSAVNG